MVLNTSRNQARLGDGGGRRFDVVIGVATPRSPTRRARPALLHQVLGVGKCVEGVFVVGKGDTVGGLEVEGDELLVEYKLRTAQLASARRKEMQGSPEN